MPITLQNLSNITSIDQLKLGADNQLQQRTGLGPFFRRVGDAFLKLSQSGRASIAQRNEKISEAMRAAVNAARADTQPEAQSISQRLSIVQSAFRLHPPPINRRCFLMC